MQLKVPNWPACLLVGGNNTQINNIFLGDNSVPTVGGIMMDFGAPGQGAGRDIAGNASM